MSSAWVVVRRRLTPSFHSMTSELTVAASPWAFARAASAAMVDFAAVSSGAAKARSAEPSGSFSSSGTITGAPHLGRRAAGGSWCPRPPKRMGVVEAAVEHGDERVGAGDGSSSGALTLEDIGPRSDLLLEGPGELGGGWRRRGGG
ncbi:MAG: hypothetical protein IPF99_02055 [Deltaproteobacteria bacterium]|nr:hypothetical protein [Deltaproteobacteria bacterium]